MPVAHRDIDALLDIVLLYVPAKPARQLLGDIYRSKAAQANASLRETAHRLMDALDQRRPAQKEEP